MKIFLIILFFVGNDGDYPVVVEGLEPRQQASMDTCRQELAITRRNLEAMPEMPAPYMIDCLEIESLMDVQRAVDHFRSGAEA